MKKKFSAACSKADRIIAISEATRTDIMEHFGIQPQRIQVIYQTIHPIFRHTPVMETISNVREKYNLPAEFILYVGSIIRRKNLEVLIKALDLMPPKKRLPLIIVGNGKIYLDYIEQLIDDLKLHHNIIRIKNPSLDEINIFLQAGIYFSVSEPDGRIWPSGTGVHSLRHSRHHHSKVFIGRGRRKSSLLHRWR